MIKSYEEDVKSNKNKKPALNKLTALDEVCRTLKNQHVQRAFLDDLDGCKILGCWLEKLPDGTYPNIMIVKAILSTLNELAIDADDLHDTPNLKKIVKEYASGHTGVQGGV